MPLANQTHLMSRTGRLIPIYHTEVDPPRAHASEPYTSPLQTVKWMAVNRPNMGERVDTTLYMDENALGNGVISEWVWGVDAADGCLKGQWRSHPVHFQV